MASKNQRKKKREIAARSATANARQHDHDQPGDVAAPAAARTTAPVRRHVRGSTETKSALKTTELAAYAATVLAIVIVSLALDADGEGGRDPFGAQEALRYITWLTIGYMVSRGLAKSGSWTTHGDSRDRTDDRSDGRDAREVHVAQVKEHVEAPRATHETQHDTEHETHQVPDHADHDVRTTAQGDATSPRDDAARATGTVAGTAASAPAPAAGTESTTGDGTTDGRDGTDSTDRTSTGGAGGTADAPADTGTPGVAPTQR